jgi:hypothetical protein
MASTNGVSQSLPWRLQNEKKSNYEVMETRDWSSQNNRMRGGDVLPPFSFGSNL